ncbi:MAG: hypothetical protein O3C40_25385 [Planctomycetota bacterium]|nr:hypothetical protein [Planctomycetota bacterium]
MAGDWIKMRVDLWHDPRVVRIASALKADKATVCGALFRTWALADQYTEDGRLAGYTSEALDAEVGVKGWSHVLNEAEWLELEADAVIVPRFDEHNGQSAKRRVMERERKRRGRDGSQAAPKASASDADKKRPREETERDRERENLDGAIDLSFEDEAEFKRIANRIAKVVPCGKPDNRSLVAKTALLVVRGKLSRDDVEQAIESVERKHPTNAGAWFQKCLDNKAKRAGENFNALLAATTIPAELLTRRSDDDAGESDRQRGPPG